MRGIETQKVGILPVWAWSLVAAGGVWLLYLFTLGPTTAWWDTSEYIATSHILGLPHPPGNPLFVVVGKAWLLLTAWLPLEVAPRINLLAATASAAAAAFWFLAVLRIWAHFTESRVVALAAGFTAVLVGGTAFTVWTQSNVNEKVYTVSLMFVALITYLAMVWEDHSETWRGDRIFLLVCFLLGLGATNHQMSVLPIVALGVFLVIHSARTLLRWRLLSAAAVLAILGYSVQLLFVPIRSAQDPIIDEADPECESVLAAVTPGFYETRDGRKLSVQCEALAASLAREQYQKPPLTERQAPFGAQFANYFQYFDWQWARSLAPSGRLLVTFLFLGLGFVGLWRHARGDPDSFAYFATLLFTVTILLVYYLNFRYGYSLNPEIPMENHEVRERDYFFIVSFNLWGVYAGMGLVTLWEGIGRRLAAAREAPLGLGLRNASPLLGIALIPVIFNFPVSDRRGDYAARDWAYNLLNSVEPYAVLFTNGDNDTFPLWYAQEVEGVRKDVTVIVGQYLHTDWYPKQLKRLTQPCPEGVDPSSDWTVIQCQRPYTFENTGAAYVTDPEAAGEKIPIVVDEIMRPARLIIPLTDEEIDQAVGGVVPVEQSVIIEIGDIEARIAGGRYLSPWQRFALTLMVESIDDRPIYFASSGNAANSLGVAPYLVRQGLAFKLHNGELSEEDTTFERLDDSSLTPVTGAWLDPDRTRLLADEVFIHRSGIPEEWAYWPDISTIGIPNYYSWVYLALSQDAIEDNDTQALDRYRTQAQAWSELGS